jgi:hypothetical protein
MYDMTSPQNISNKVLNLLLEILPTQQQQAVGFYADLTWFLSFPANGFTIAYYLPTQEWTQLPYATNSVAFATQVPADLYGAGYKWNQVLAVRAGTNIIDAWMLGQESDLGLGTSVSWTSPPSDSGNAHAEKDYQFVSLEAPVQTGVATVVLTVLAGGGNVSTSTQTFDLSKGPIQMQRVQQANCRGYLAYVTVSFATAPGATQPIQIYAVEIGGNSNRSWVINNT